MIGEIKKKPVPSPPAVSSFVKGGLGLLITANIDMIVAISTPYWATWTAAERGEHGGYGLWTRWKCKMPDAPTDGLAGTLREYPDSCEVKFTDTSFGAWYVTSQVLGCLCLSGFLSALIMLLMYIFYPQWNRSKSVMSGIITTSYLSGVFIVVCLFIFGFKVAEEIESLHPSEWILSWSFSLACTAFFLNQIGASILITERKRIGQSKKQIVDSQEEMQELVVVKYPS